MLIIVSDLHFVDETSGRHNPSFGAFEHVFLPHIVALARRKDAKEIKLLLLGDTFDFLRTEGWFAEDLADRPWGANGLLDVPVPRPGSATEARCLRILGTLPENGGKETLPTDTILHQNWESIAFIREFGERVRHELKRDIPVEVIFIAGNHDRLCNLYPSLRDETRRLLGASIADGAVEREPNGTWWFRDDYIDEAHGVYARHGHQYDFWNFGGGTDYTRMGHIRTPVGDPLGVEFAAKLPYRLRQFKDAGEKVSEALIEEMKELGLVRPFTHAMQWLYYRFKNTGRGDVRRVLDQAFHEVFAEMLNVEFMRRWSTPLSKVDIVVRAISSRWLRWLPKTVIRRLDAENLLPFFAGIGPNPRDPDLDAHLVAAFNEPIARENPNIRYILYGHTHFPMESPIEASQTRNVVYINSGSWRQNIFRTLGPGKNHGFMKFGQIAYTIFYRGDEDLEDKRPGTVSYEAWIGKKQKEHPEGSLARL
jgi:UDP-2,3-diacylglucosamine pyrophosphatase LpxH